VTFRKGKVRASIDWAARNAVAGAIALAFYLANLACIMVVSGCMSGPIEVFVDLIESVNGVIF